MLKTTTRETAQPAPQQITAELFLKYTGRPPEMDDLERCNCPKRGFGHSFCGWNSVLNMPRYQVGDATEL